MRGMSGQNEKNAELLKAVAAQDLQAVQIALLDGASPDAQDENGVQVLLHASNGVNMMIVNVLLQAGANPVLPDMQYERMFMQSAIAHGYTHIYDALRGAGASIERRENETTLLSLAAYSGQAKIVKRMLDDGADPNACGSGDSPLRAAMGAGVLGDNEACVALLLEAGADVHAKGYDHHFGGMVSELESARRRSPVVRGMVEASACGQEAFRQYEIFRAIDGQDTERLQELLARGTANVTNANGDTALIYAIQTKYARGVNALLTAGADIGAMNAQGKNALQCADESPRKDIATAVRAQHESNVQKLVDESLTVSKPIKVSPALRLKPRAPRM